MGKVLVERSLRSPSLFPQGARPLIKNRYFSPLLRALRRALNNASAHFMTQQARLSFNLICIEHAEAGHRAAEPEE